MTSVPVFTWAGVRRPERPAYDPRAHGASCGTCPLSDNGNPCSPVGPEIPRHNTSVSHNRLVIVGEGPGKAETREGRPFIGASGQLLNQALIAAGTVRRDVHVTNATRCKPTRKLSPEEWKQALVACRPALLSEFPEPPAHAVALGKWAFATLTGKLHFEKHMLTPIMGKAEFAKTLVLPVYHPAFALRQPAYLPVFRIGISRGAELAAGRLQVDPPPKALIDDGEEMRTALRQILASTSDIAVDIENAGASPFVGDLLCVGLSTGACTVSVPWPCSSETFDLLRRALASPNTKVMHNGAHDILGLKRFGLEVGGPLFDTILSKATVGSQTKHNLQFTAALELPIAPWKTNFRADSDLKGSEAFSKRDQYELRTYNAEDAYRTWQIKPRHVVRIARMHRGQEHFDRITKLGNLAMRMTGRGWRVDPSRFDAHRVQLSTEMQQAAETLRERFGDELELGANGQNGSVSDFFFKALGVQPIDWSEKTGAASLNKRTLRHLLVTGDADQKFAAKHVLLYREKAKLRSTYLDGLPIGPDGLVHSNFKVFGTVTRRWSSSGPNLQNVPAKMRNIFVPRPGNYIVAADYSQLENRIMAVLSGEPRLLDGFARGEDYHTMNAQALFPDKVITKESKERGIAKVFNYALAYGSTVESMWEQLTMRGVNITLDALEELMKRLKKSMPTLFGWQKQLLRDAAKTHYVETPFTQWREYFHDGRVEANKVLNFPLQGGAADVVNDAALKVDARLDWSRESFLAQVHDELVLEGPDPARLEAILTESMVRTVKTDKGEIVLTISVHSGDDWSQAK